jgi:uncharacterized protein
MSNVVNSLREAFFMFWETLWALVVGFGLSGVVQAFVSKDQMQRVMGDHRVPSILRASGFGMVSSSCSYAATAMAKSLFQKGADFIAAMTFMFASTNLVVELGVVSLILMGWQFAAAEFIGGAVMIVLLVLVGSFALRGIVADSAPVGHNHDAAKGKLADAASYAIADITMLRKELLVGYVVAGFLAVLVPMQAWNDVFLRGHGFWTSAENVIVGPFIAFISFVCSVGNVPMAAALWHGGISFGGVIAFIFADLITLPLVLIYRKYYGTKVALRLFATFYVVMAAAGLIVEGLFALVGAVPAHRHSDIAATHFEWNYTTFLNIGFLVVFGVMYWLHRSRKSSDGFASDVVCGMQVQTANAPAHVTHGGHDYWFCSDRCRERFEANPAKFTAPGAVPEGMDEGPVPNVDVTVTLGRKPPPPP